MDVTFLKNEHKEKLFICCCGWIGTHSDLDKTQEGGYFLSCCPKCKNADVRIKLED